VKRLSIFASLLGLLFLTAIPIFAQDETIVDVAAGNEDFRRLVTALEVTGLTSTLQGEGPFTVFAPTDEAFQTTLDELGLSMSDLTDNVDMLTAILTYHVVEGAVFSGDLTEGEVTTLNGAAVEISLADGVMVNDANVVTADLEASNGVIHVIDRVLLPPEDPGTIVDVAFNSEDFNTLIAALDAADLVDTLAGAGPFTVFAPTDAAFAAILDAMGITAEELLADTETLTEILTYHVLSGEFAAEDVLGLDSQAVETVNGAPLNISIVNGAVVLNDSVNVVTTDVEANNGVIHVIDAVLLPPEPETFNIRVAHFSPDTPAVDVFLNGDRTIGLTFRTITGWVELPVGTYEIVVVPEGAPIEEAAIGPVELTFAENSWTTIAAIGSLQTGTLQAQVIEEDFASELEAGSARLTVFHAIELAGPVDVFANGAELIDFLAYPGAAGENDGVVITDVPAGSYDLSVTVFNTPDAELIAANDVAIEAGNFYFIAAVGTPGDPRFQIAVTAPESE